MQVLKEEENSQMKRLLITNLSQIATPTGSSLKAGKEMEDIRFIEDGAILIEGEEIKLVGTTKEVLALAEDTGSCQLIDGSGKCAVPGFVDSHTHFIFGGYRPQEFMARLSGSDYLEIMKMGGGIQASVNATRAADKEKLIALGKSRLFDMLSQGITTVEGKSGYGLDYASELKQLEVMEELKGLQPVDIEATYLGGHAVPTEYKGKPEEYIDFMIQRVLPAVKDKNLARFCDIFCEDSVFSIEQSRRLLTAAKAMGFQIKIHADEIVDLGGGRLAGELGAISADHLLMASEESIGALKKNGVVATLLPNTAFCLNKPFAPARKIIESGCGVALASDFNPGSCFSNSVPLMLALAVIHMKMTLNETLTAITLNGAAALGLEKEIGSIEPGKKADINLLSYPSYEFLIYHTGSNVVEKVIKKGELVFERGSTKSKTI
jgi:imidazolonepropionase